MQLDKSNADCPTQLGTICTSIILVLSVAREYMRQYGMPFFMRFGLSPCNNKYRSCRAPVPLLLFKEDLGTRLADPIYGPSEAQPIRMHMTMQGKGYYTILPCYIAQLHEVQRTWTWWCECSS